MLRPLGMLVFGLSVIVVFIRMHGDGYDFPDKVSQSNDSFLPLQNNHHHHHHHRTDTVVLEVSTLFPEEPTVIHPQDPTAALFLYDEVPIDNIADAMGSENEQKQAVKQPLQEEGGNKESNGGGSGWNRQWSMGRKTQVPSPDQQQDDAPLASRAMGRGGEEQAWAWLTMIQHEGDRCQPGLLQQYGRPLKSILHREDSNKWRLLYTHKLPGSIIHTSVSRRLVPLSEAIRARRRSERADAPSSEPTRETTLHDHAREVIRLGVVYKVIQDETAVYYLRVYHFGRFQPADKPLQDDCSGQASDCYQQDPFVFFDYELPGTMPLKDFTLEHDMIIYTRANDPHMFRYIELPKLRVGATLQEQPYKLVGGSTGPKQACRDTLNLIYRTSELSLLPRSHPSDKRHRVLLARVQEDAPNWVYESSIATLDENQQWTSEPGRIHRPEVVQDTDPIYEESTNYVVPKPDPIIVRSLDGKLVLLPCKNFLDIFRSNFDAASLSTGTGHDQALGRQSRWHSFRIDGVTFEVMDPDKAVLSDDKTVIAMKTKRNNVLILRQKPVMLGLDGSSSSTWQMVMVLSDDNYLFTPTPNRYKREVRAMRVLQVPRSQLRTRGSDGDTAETEDLARSGDAKEPPTEREGEDPLEHILLMVFGDGNLVVYNLDAPTASSSAWTFMLEKYQVVIGMLAVVVVFVINEAR